MGVDLDVNPLWLTITSFAQAWRKRSTMSYTKFTKQCCQSLANRELVPTDALIAPMIRMSDLMCRINDYFRTTTSRTLEVQGESLLDMSMKSFREELERIIDSTPSSIRQNSEYVRFEYVAIGPNISCSYGQPAVLSTGALDPRMLTTYLTLEHKRSARHKLSSSTAPTTDTSSSPEVYEIVFERSPRCSAIKALSSRIPRMGGMVLRHHRLQARLLARQ